MISRGMVVCIALLALCAVRGSADEGEWARYRVLRAHERKPVAIEEVQLTLGPREQGLQWWQLEAHKADGGTFVVQALSQWAPMTHEDGQVGRVQRYLFRPAGGAALEYVEAWSGLAYLPRFGFRTG